MGELYAAELVLPVFAIMLVVSGKASSTLRSAIFWKFFLAGMVMIVGYMISDLIAGTSQQNYLRAWGRNAVLLSDLLALSVMAGSDKRYIWWYIFGVTIGTLIYLQTHGIVLNNYTWKLEGYGRAILMLVLLLGYFLPNLMTIGLIVCFGLASIYMDSRSQGAIALLLAGLLWVRKANPVKLNISARNMAKFVIAGIVVLLMILVAMAQTGDEYSDRRGASNVERFGALKVGLIAITDSPLIGFGSWGQGTKKYAEMYRKETEKDLRHLGQTYIQYTDTFMPHSQILQSWMEGGILSAFFFLFFGFKLLASMKYVVFGRYLDYLTPIYIITLFGSAWNLVMSPYSGNHRLGIAMAVAIVCSLTIERRKAN